MDAFKNKKILIVEDEIIIALDIKNTLKSLGYEKITIAESGESALEEIDREKPDLVLMDIGLSGSMDGIDTAVQIQAVAPGLHVMFLTSYSNLRIRERVGKIPHSGYLLKPFSPDLLGEAVLKILSGQQ
jgi:DNA-binding NarL/FixJ family response regulator